MASSVDAHGTYIEAADLPKGLKPPYRSTVAWQGQEGPWRLTAVRVEGDPIPHVTAHHRDGWSHAARLENASPASVRRWARGLPSTWPVDAPAA